MLRDVTVNRMLIFLFLYYYFTHFKSFKCKLFINLLNKKYFASKHVTPYTDSLNVTLGVLEVPKLLRIYKKITFLKGKDHSLQMVK